MEDGFLPSKHNGENTGLCGSATTLRIDNELLKLFEPNKEECEQLVEENTSSSWWGYGIHYHDPAYSTTQRHHGFTPLRQTIVLFMAAMNNEL
jgi:hypothetical protein